MDTVVFNRLTRLGITLYNKMGQSLEDLHNSANLLQTTNEYVTK